MNATVEATPHHALELGKIYRIHTTLGMTGLVRICRHAGELCYVVLSNGRIDPVRTEPEGTVFTAFQEGAQG